MQNINSYVYYKPNQYFGCQWSRELMNQNTELSQFVWKYLGPYVRDHNGKMILCDLIKYMTNTLYNRCYVDKNYEKYKLKSIRLLDNEDNILGILISYGNSYCIFTFDIIED